MTIFVQIQSIIMPKARRTSYNLAFKLKVIAEAEAVENNSEIAREYGISESMVRRWRKKMKQASSMEKSNYLPNVKLWAATLQSTLRFCVLIGLYANTCVLILLLKLIYFSVWVKLSAISPVPLLPLDFKTICTKLV